MRTPTSVLFYKNPGNDLTWINQDTVFVISSPEVAPAINFGAGILFTSLSLLKDLAKRSRHLAMFLGRRSIHS